LRLIVNGLKETRHNIGVQGVAHFKDLEKPLNRCGIYMMESVGKNFKAGGRPKKWDSLSKRTKKIDPRRNSGTPLTINGDNIRKKIDKKVTKYKVTVGASGKIAHVQQFGARIKITDRMRRWFAFKEIYLPLYQTEIIIPARPFVLFQTEDLKSVKDIFIKWSGEYKK